MENLAWNASLYQQFLDWRTQPARDLVARIDLKNPGLIVDLGCGTGNSTEVCVRRWPSSRIIGVDNSAEMLAVAQTSVLGPHWHKSDIDLWLQTGPPADLIFSSSALQWIQPHSELFPKLISRLKEQGCLAAQMPDYNSPAHIALRQLVQDSDWRQTFESTPPSEWISHSLPTYFDYLRPHTSRLELWKTEYCYELADIGEIVKWYSSTGLRPYQAVIADPLRWGRFLRCFAEALETVFPPTASGSRLFAIPRVFVLAYR